MSPLTVVSDSIAVLFENAFCESARAPERDFLVSVMVLLILASETRSEALRRTKRGLNARQGMEGAKNAYREFQEVRRADTLIRGFQVARNRASPLQSQFHRNDNDDLITGIDRHSDVTKHKLTVVACKKSSLC